MLMAKASDDDLNMAMDLCSMLDALGHRFCPAMPEVIAKDGEEWFDRHDDDQCGRVLRVLLETLERGSLMRVVFGAAVMLDPRNKLVDPAADTIQHHPEREQAMMALRRLSAAALARDSTMGDLAGLLAAKAELDDARKAADAVLELATQPVKGGGL